MWSARHVRMGGRGSLCPSPIAFVTGLVAVALLAPAAARAQGSPSGRLVVDAVRVDVPPVMDGLLDDPAWTTAPRLAGFVQQRPIEGAPAVERTEVSIAYDSQRLYVGIRAHYTDVSLVRANRVDRDQTMEDDTVTVTLDPFSDGQRGYQFSVNGYGVQADSILSSSGFGGGDFTWNTLYDSGGVLTDDGWTAEMAIPFKSLRYPGKAPDEEHRWGLQVERVVRSKDEVSHWSALSSDVLGVLTQMGTLRGMRGLSTVRNLEVLPTVTAVQAGRLDADGRFRTEDVEEAGINIKYGLTSNLTLDFTYNPDFSQIESDRPQIQVNQRFPVFFPELRPFFIEGQEIFSVGIGPPIRLLHTRAVVDPQAGVKLTGKVGGNTLGLLVANDEAPGKGDPTAAGFGKTAKVLIARFRRDLYKDSFAGVLLLDREFLGQYSRVVDFDAQLAIGQNYQLNVKVIPSRHRDAQGVERSGHLLDVMHRRVGRHFTYIMALNDVTPGFRNDLGFVPRTYRRPLANVEYKWWPEGMLVNWGPKFTFDHSEDYDTGELQQQIRQLSVSSLWARNITLTGSINSDRERFAGVDFSKQRMAIGARINTSSKALLSIDVGHGDEIRYVDSPFLGSTTGVNLGVTLRPSSRLQSDVSVITNRFRDLRSGEQVFDVKIYYVQTTYQFTDRLLLRNILEHNTLNGTLGLNLLGTYRVNAGTVFFVGYDDRYRQADRIVPGVFADDQYRRTNRAVFAKFSYLFRR